MSFYEDERIRRKNTAYNAKSYNISLKDDQLKSILELLQKEGFVVELRNNTITIS